MPYDVELPDGRIVSGIPDDMSREQVRDIILKKFPEFAPAKEEAPAPVAPTPATGFSSFVPAVKRGYYGLESLLGDVAPAMAGRIGEKLGIQGAKEYADKQMQEAAEASERIKRDYPTSVESFTNIKGAGDALTYIVESVGELIPSMLPSIFTGGAATVASRGAVAAAKLAAEKAARDGAAKGLAAKEIEEIALKAGVDAARKTALKYEATGAVAGSAAQNIPEVYQNIAESTGKESLGAALVAGGFNSVLDAITPLKLLRAARHGEGISTEAMIGAWTKRLGKGFLEGFATEGATEALQEMSSAAAEKFVGDHNDFFTKDNFIRFIDAGLKGGLGGGVASGATSVAFGHADTKKDKTATDIAKDAVDEATNKVDETVAAPAGMTSLDEIRAKNKELLGGTKDVGEIDSGTAGAGTEVSAQQGNAKPAAGTATDESGGLDVTEATSNVVGAGKKSEHDSLIEARAKDFANYLTEHGVDPTTTDPAELNEWRVQWAKDRGIKESELTTQEPIKEEPTKQAADEELTADEQASLQAELEEEQAAKPKPKTVEEERINKQNTKKQQNEEKANIDAKAELSAQQKRAQSVAANYYVASQNTPRGAVNPLDLLAGDLFAKAKTDEFMPGTGGKHAKEFYNSLKDEHKAYVDKMVEALGYQHEAAKKAKERFDKKQAAKREEKESYAPEVKLTKKEEKNLNRAARRARTWWEDNPEVRREIRGTTTEKLVAHVFLGNTRAALNEIANSETTNRFSAFDKLVADRLAKSHTLPHIEIVPQSVIGKGDGQYISRTDTAQIAEGQVDSHTVLHEVSHGFLHNIIQDYQAGKNNNQGVAKLDKLYKTLLADHSYLSTMDSTKYGMGSLTEFASELMSNPEFQLELSKIPYERVNALTAFAQAVLRILGINPSEKATALAAGLIHIDRLLTTGRQYQENEITGKVANAPALVAARTPKQAEDYSQKGTLEELISAMPGPQEQPISEIKKVFNSVEGAKKATTWIQNDRHPAKVLQNLSELAHLINHTGMKQNNYYSQIVLSTGRAEDLYHTELLNPVHDVHEAIGEYAKIRKINIDRAMKELQVIFTALHEPERRHVKYLMTVPLNAKAADVRKNILATVRSGKIDEATAKALRADLEELVRDNKMLGGYDDEGPSTRGLDEKGIDYNVAGIAPHLIEEARAMANDPRNAVAVKHIREALQKVHEVTKELNKRANYWSQPVSNIAAFYDFKDYVPLKGRPGEKLSKIDEMLDLDSKRNGAEMQEAAYQWEGRLSISDNPILQSLSDGVRAALRAGRGGTEYDANGKVVLDESGKPAQFGLTFALKNAINQKLIPGHKVGKTISFEDRYAAGEEILRQKGENVFFHYNDDGSIEIYAITDPTLRDAIRRTYKGSQVVTDFFNDVTSKIGQLHTRYNPAFAPMNFVRDTLTNAFTISAEMGIGKGRQYIAAVSAKVATNGLGKALQVARLYEKGEFSKIEAMGKKDAFVQAMYEYIVTGGKVSYLEGVAIQSQFQKIQKDINKAGVLTSKEKIDGVMDIWVDMFELTSRAAGYQIIRDQYIQEGLSPKEAQVKAASYVKELANFEQVGRLGRAAGAFFMFFRPAATGAVRSIEALSSVWRNAENAWTNLPEGGRYLVDDKGNFVKGADGQRVINQKAKDAFMAEMAKKKRAAAATSIALGGLGAFVYGMSMLMAGDDDEGRNEVATDDMARWTRYARFHIPGTKTIFQMPWGFGLGSFAGAGAQLAAFGSGNLSTKDLFLNIKTIGMDSFLPLPSSQIDMFANPAAWLMDTATPSLFRPFFEYAMNLDGLGREIYNNRQSRVGDAYTGGDNIPELYKDAARMLADITNGGLNWSPNTMYFFANNYADGISRVIHNTYNIGLVAAGQKDFNPKTDTIMFDSFFGAKSNFDARQFSNIENDIKNKEKNFNMFKSNPEQLARYLDSNPNDPAIIALYHKGLGNLNKLREMSNKYRMMSDLSPKERTELLDNNKQQENLIKRNMINMFEAYDIKP